MDVSENTMKKKRKFFLTVYFRLIDFYCNKKKKIDQKNWKKKTYKQQKIVTLYVCLRSWEIMKLCVLETRISKKWNNKKKSSSTF